MFEVEGVLVGIACESEPEPVAYTGMVLFAGVGACLSCATRAL